MGLGWANDEEIQFLQGFMPQYEICQVKRNYQSFWPVLFAAYQSKFPLVEKLWPNLGMTMEKLTEEENKLYNKKLKSRHDSLKEWFRWRANPRSRNTTTAVTKKDLKNIYQPSRKRGHKSYEVFAKLYPDTVDAIVEETCRIQGVTGKAKLPIWHKVVSGLWSKATQEQVDAVNAQMENEAIEKEDEPDELDGSKGGEPSPETYQHYQKLLPGIFTATVDPAVRKAGMIALCTIIGPVPEAGGQIISTTLQFGDSGGTPLFSSVWPGYDEAYVENLARFVRKYEFSEELCRKRSVAVENNEDLEEERTSPEGSSQSGPSPIPVVEPSGSKSSSEEPAHIASSPQPGSVPSTTSSSSSPTPTATSTLAPGSSIPLPQPNHSIAPTSDVNPSPDAPQYGVSQPSRANGAHAHMEETQPVVNSLYHPRYPSHRSPKSQATPLAMSDSQFGPYPLNPAHLSFESQDLLSFDDYQDPNMSGQQFEGFLDSWDLPGGSTGRTWEDALKRSAGQPVDLSPLNTRSNGDWCDINAFNAIASQGNLGQDQNYVHSSFPVHPLQTLSASQPLEVPGVPQMSPVVQSVLPHSPPTLPTPHAAGAPQTGPPVQSPFHNPPPTTPASQPINASGVPQMALVFQPDLPHPPPMTSTAQPLTADGAPQTTASAPHETSPSLTRSTVSSPPTVNSPSNTAESGATPPSNASATGTLAMSKTSEVTSAAAPDTTFMLSMKTGFGTSLFGKSFAQPAVAFNEPKKGRKDKPVCLPKPRNPPANKENEPIRGTSNPNSSLFPPLPPAALHPTSQAGPPTPASLQSPPPSLPQPPHPPNLQPLPSLPPPPPGALQVSPTAHVAPPPALQASPPNPPPIVPPPTVPPPTVPPPTVPPSDPVNASVSSQESATRRSARGPVKNTWLEKQNLIGTNVAFHSASTATAAAVENAGDEGPPPWFTDALDHLQMHDLGDAWRLVIDQWVGLETILGYGKVAKTPLPVQNRPDEWTRWASKTKRGVRPYDKTPEIADPAEFGLAVLKWWYSIQPPFRASDNNFPRPVFSDPTYEGDPWAAIRRSGPNGIVVLLTLLAWWGRITLTPNPFQDDSRPAWTLLVQDVRLCLEEMSRTLPQVGEKRKRGEEDIRMEGNKRSRGDTATSPENAC